MDVGDFCLSPAFFACLQDTYHPKGVVSGQSGGPYSSLSARGPQLSPGYVVSCHLAPAPVSLLLSRDLPSGWTGCFLGVHFPLGLGAAVCAALRENLTFAAPSGLAWC